jgi:hypothetical protein
MVAGWQPRETKNLSIMKTWKKGEEVSLITQDGNDIFTGKTIENESESPINGDPFRRVVRIQWEDGTQTIENTKDLF